MSNKIDRRTFLKCTGASAAALGTAALLGGCQQTASGASVEVKVGDKINNWNNLAVQLAGIYDLPASTGVEGTKYVAILISAGNRSKTDSFAIGAQNILDIDAAYPLTDEATKAANIIGYFNELSTSTTDFAAVCDGNEVPCGAYISLYDSTSETFADSPSLPSLRAGYVELICQVPNDWKQLTVIYHPTFVKDKTLTFTMYASDLSAS